MRTPRKFSSSSPLCGRGSFRGRRRSAELGGGGLYLPEEEVQAGRCSVGVVVIAAGVYGQELIGSAGGNAEIHLAALELGVYPLLHKGGVGGLKGVLYALVVGGPPGIIIEGLFGLLIVYLIERPYLPLPVDAVKGYLPGAALGGLEAGQGVGVKRFLALALGALGLAQVYLLNVVELMEHGLAHAGIMGG